jgi:hypothetical protein
MVFISRRNFASPDRNGILLLLGKARSPKAKDRMDGWNMDG